MKHQSSRPVAQVTAHQVAGVAGVSQSAVSRAFTPGASIAQATRNRILQVAKELGYRPNLLARSLIKRRSQIIGVAVGYFDNQFNPQALETLSNELQGRGYHVLLFTPEENGTADLAVASVMQFRVEGLILCSANLSSDLTRECAVAGVPVVLFNRTTSSPLVSSVTGDNVNGGRAIAQFLAEGGHKRFAYMAGLEESSTSREREYGYSWWFASNNYPPPMRVVGNYDFETSKEATRTLCRAKHRPDALFCANDHMALAALDVCRFEFGLRVPEDISVVGFDDVGAARWPSFDLTTYSQPVRSMATETVRLLMTSVDEGGINPMQVVVKGELIVRSSAKRPSKGLVDLGDRTIYSI